MCSYVRGTNCYEIVKTTNKKIFFCAFCQFTRYKQFAIMIIVPSKIQTNKRYCGGIGIHSRLKICRLEHTGSSPVSSTKRCSQVVKATDFDSVIVGSTPATAAIYSVKLKVRLGDL